MPLIEEEFSTNQDEEPTKRQCSNPSEELAIDTTTIPSHEEEPRTEKDKEPTPNHTTIATK